jgi:hypothetical protein
MLGYIDLVVLKRMYVNVTFSTGIRLSADTEISVEKV